MSRVVAPFRNPLVVALDTEMDAAKAIAADLADHVGGFKIGPRLVFQDSGVVAEIAQLAPVFVDSKFLDIPNVVEANVRAAFHAGSSVVTIMGWAGTETLERIAKVEAELNAERPFRVLAVTILTSFNQETLPFGLREKPIAQQIEGLIEDGLKAGIKSFVCSAQDLSELRGKYSEAYFLTPGIRRASIAGDDQKRVVTPAQAMELGSNSIVVGRPILQAEDPKAETLDILKEMGL